MSTAEERLGETHRLAQTRVGSETAALALRSFSLLDPDDFDGTYPSWTAALIPVVQAQRGRSVALASVYVTGARRIALGPRARAVDIVPAEPLDVEALLVSLLVTGPVAFRARVGRGVDRQQAARLTRSGVASSALRHAMNGGRETVLRSIQADPRARGWRRVVSGGACAFCRMLAGRGAVYSKDAVDFGAHDNCSCSAAPTWSDEPTRSVRDYMPSRRTITPEARAVRNERVRAFIAANGV
jgi:hypothetical protein